MIKEQPTTKEKPVFGVDFKKKRVQKVEKPVAPRVSKPVKPCAFQVLVEVPDKKSPWLGVMQSEQCKNEAIANGWCSDHQHAQDGMNEGERLGYRSVEIPVTRPYGDEEPFKIIIGQGKQNWLAYFERATGSGLAKVMDFLSRQ